MGRVLFSIGLICFALSSCKDIGGPCCGHPNQYYIEGVVTDSSTGRPIPGVTVEVGANGVAYATDISDADGKYSVTHTGNEIHAIVHGYYTYSASLGDIGKSSTITYDIALIAGGIFDTSPPSAPLTLTVSSYGKFISWLGPTASSDLAGYTVYRDAVAIGATYFSEFLDYNAVDGSLYCYTVAAFDASGNESVRSGEMCGFALLDRFTPVGPYFVSLTTISSTEIRIDWESQALWPYRIYRDGVFAGSLAAGENYGPDQYSSWYDIYYMDSGLSPGVKYCYTVTLVTSGGETQPTPQLCITTWPN